ncbi:MAG TPA: ATP-binding cassette domain-containing protein [Rectinemataceae bacterium]|nr:ATP-binding cassette domain-containing protein [Rectinemataceae bacterium]
MMNYPMVKLDKVSFSYRLKQKTLPVLSDISVNFERGSITAIVGRSGCGKTSLLRVIAGLSSPTEGWVSVGGEAGGSIRAKTALIFQDYGLLPWASVQANAELGLRTQGIASAERRSRVDPILAELELRPFARLYPARLSGGMRQRVAVARALASDSDLLLLDEPFSSLDALTRESLQETLLETQRKHGTTIILVTHSIEEAAYLADTIYILDGKNPSTLSARFDTGRRQVATASGEASNRAALSFKSFDALSRSSAATERATGAAAFSYRESDHYFSNVAALRHLFTNLPLKEGAIERKGEDERETDAGRSRPRAGALISGFLLRLGKIALAASVLTLLWAGLSSILGKPFLPSPLVAARRFGDATADGTLFIHIGASLRRIFLALAMAGPPAWALGLLSGRIKAADAIASPLVYFLHPLPKVAFLPILMLFFGLGDASKVALMGMVVFGQLFVGGRDSAKAIPFSLIDTVRSLGVRGGGVLRYAILPATLPSLLSSLRISLGTAIAVLFLSETFASMDGLGWYIMDSWSRVDYPDMYAAIIALSLVGLALYLALDALEAFALRWRETD